VVNSAYFLIGGSYLVPELVEPDIGRMPLALDYIFHENTRPRWTAVRSASTRTSQVVWDLCAFLQEVSN
jgi:hypothetical protein